MLHATNSKNAKKATSRKVQFKGITADAKSLGVNRTTLWRVLNGQWKLDGLKNRYQALKKKEAK